MHIPCGRRLSFLVASALGALVLLCAIAPPALHAAGDAPDFTLDPPTVVFINEIHYTNAGTDANEQIEIAAPTGTDMSSARVRLYNQAGNVYGTIMSLGAAVRTCGDYDLYVVAQDPIQNGPSDGLVLYNDATNVLVQYLSYGGVATGNAAIANGVTSTDIGVEELDNDTPADYSLQLSGSGGVYDDFTWQSPGPATFGACNTGQTLTLPATLIELANFSAQAGADGITLTWETAVEVDNAGFHLSRGATEADAARITPRLIGAQAQPGHGARYTFVDPAGDAASIYWLDDVATDGTSTRHGPFAVDDVALATASHRIYLPTINAGNGP